MPELEENILYGCKYLDKRENGCKENPIYDPDTKKFLGYLACTVIDLCELKKRLPVNELNKTRQLMIEVALKSLMLYLPLLNNDQLYNLFEKTIDEINKRKTLEMKAEDE